MRRSLFAVADDEFRPDVEGLRAIAVLAVLLFHVGVASFGGGFVGVDVFFVLSGFLITRLLLRELATTGTISLPAFWARRARRLLPSSCLVIVATVVAAHWLLPPLAQRSLAVDAAASGAFVVNFVFAHRLGDYFGAQLSDVAPSPLLHFWSLAVEEQFYLLWPAFLVAVARRPRQYRRVVVTSIVTIGVASFVLSAWLTDVRPTWAFYLLPARMGELLAGAALAAAGPAFRARVGARVRAAAAGSGSSASSSPSRPTTAPRRSRARPRSCRCCAPCSSSSPAASAATGSGPIVLLRARPLQWIGRHSYAIYLWHWPVLVLAEARFGPLPMATRVALVLASVGLAALSVRFVEDPTRYSRWLARRPTRGLTLGAALCSVAIAVGWASVATAPDARHRAGRRRSGAGCRPGVPPHRRSHPTRRRRPSPRSRRDRRARSAADADAGARSRRPHRPARRQPGRPRRRASPRGTSRPTCGRRWPPPTVTAPRSTPTAAWRSASRTSRRRVATATRRRRPPSCCSATPTPPSGRRRSSSWPASTGSSWWCSSRAAARRRTSASPRPPSGGRARSGGIAPSS